MEKKKIDIDRYYVQAAVLGTVAGMRAMSAPAIACRMVATRGDDGLTEEELPAFLQSDATNTVLSLLAIAEFVGDKLPNTPNRTATPGLIARCVSGAISGAAVCRANRRNVFAGALVGGVSALASSFACFYLRRAVVKGSSLPDATVGGMEDALVLATGLGLTALG